MLLAGDIGGTKTVLAVFSPEKGAHAPLVEATFPSGRYGRLEAIVREFMTQITFPIDRACFGVNRLGESVDRSFAGQIDGQELGLSTLLANGGRRRFTLFFRNVGDDDRRSGLGKRRGRRLADAGRGPGYDGRLVFEAHGLSLVAIG